MKLLAVTLFLVGLFIVGRDYRLKNPPRSHVIGVNIVGFAIMALGAITWANEN